MFVTSQIRDKITLHPAHTSENDIIMAINSKYANRNLKDQGIAILTKNIIKIHEFRVIENCIVCKVEFDLLLFKFIDDEVAYGTISEQNENGIFVDVCFYGKVFIPKKLLFNEFEIVICPVTKKSQYWMWNYKGHKLYFKNKGLVKFKVFWGNGVLMGRIDESGLGPVEWWE